SIPCCSTPPRHSCPITCARNTSRANMARRLTTASLRDDPALLHQRLDFGDLARNEADALETLFRDDVVVLDPDAGVLVLLHHGSHRGDERAVLRRVRQHVE